MKFKEVSAKVPRGIIKSCGLKKEKSISEVLYAFEVRGEEIELNRIIDYALKLDAVTVKRLGVEPARLEMLVKLPIRGYRKLDPTGPRWGPAIVAG